MTLDYMFDHPYCKTAVVDGERVKTKEVVRYDSQRFVGLAGAVLDGT